MHRWLFALLLWYISLLCSFPCWHAPVRRTEPGYSREKMETNQGSLIIIEVPIIRPMEYCRYRSLCQHAVQSTLRGWWRKLRFSAIPKLDVQSGIGFIRTGRRVLQSLRTLPFAKCTCRPSVSKMPISKRASFLTDRMLASRSLNKMVVLSPCSFGVLVPDAPLNKREDRLRKPFIEVKEISVSVSSKCPGTPLYSAKCLATSVVSV